MKIALFGGAFDPPHLGHAQVANFLVTQKIVAQVWYVPTGVHDFAKQMAPAEHRQAMLELILTPATKIETSELTRPGVSHSYQTLKLAQAQYPTHQFSWVIGADNLAKFHLWQDYQKILAEFPVWVYPRTGHELTPLYPGMTVIRGCPQIDISSTLVKQTIAQGKSLTGLIDPAVINYLNYHQLYQPSEGQ